MATRLKTRPLRRAVAGLALVLAVMAVHGCVAGRLASHLAEQAQARSEDAALTRIEVAYVREMELAAPPQAGAPPPPPRPPKKRRAVAAPAAASAPPVEPEPAPPAAAEAPVPEVPLAAASVPEAQPEPAASAPEAFDWPASTRLSYVLTGNYRGEVHGHAQVEWIRAGSRYQVHLDVTVGLRIAPLMSRRMSSEGEITAGGLAPRRYEQETRLAFQEPRRLAMRFEPDGVLLAGGRSRAAVPGAQDTASQFVQLSWLFGTRPELLRVGNTIELAVALPRNTSPWVYDVLAEETLYTGFGPVSAFHLKPRRAMGHGDLIAESWFAPELRYLPVRIRIHQDAETFVDLMIARRPEMAGR